MHEAVSSSDAVREALKAVLLACDADRLARQLGLRSAKAAEALRANPVALERLAVCFARGSDDGDVGTLMPRARALLGVVEPQ